MVVKATQISADWRFLDLLPRRGRALVVGPAVPDLESVFETTTVANDTALPDSGFDLVVITSGEGSALERTAMALMDPGGLLVTGVGAWTSDRTFGKPAFPGVASLKRKARRTGLDAVAVYGAVPNPWNPEYLYPMGGAAARVAIERFLRSRKPSSQTVALLLRLPTPLLSAVFTTGALVVLRRAGGS